jgi:hypothetical protein
MRKFKSTAHAQHFLSVHGIVRKPFRAGRHLLRAVHHRLLRTRSFQLDSAILAATRSPICAIVRLGLACAQAASGEVASARTTCQDFFAGWKDADPDLPILIAAKQEYARLP